jgi:hypothetical protein
VTEDPNSADRFNPEQLAERRQAVERARYLQDLPDEEVIAHQPGPSDDRHLMEMIRRLKDVDADLKDEIVTFRTSSDTAARKLAVLTYVIIVLTVALVFLTTALVILTVRGGP